MKAIGNFKTGIKRPLYFIKIMLPFWKKEVLILLLSFIGMALGLVNPYLSKLIIDRAYVNKDVKLFISLVMLAGVIFVLTAILKGAGDYLNRYIRLRIGLKLEQKVFKKLQGL